MPSHREQDNFLADEPLPALPMGTVDRGYDREILAWLGLGLFALFVLGFYLMRQPGSDQGNPLNPDRAVFASVSAVTLTGLRQDLRESTFAAADSQLMPATLLVLTVGASWLTLVAAGLPACRLLGVRRNAKPVVLAATVTVLGGTILGGIPLLLTYSPLEVDGAARLPWLDAFLTSASAVGNSGVCWNRLPRADAWQTQAILLPLAVIGGLGVPVLIDLYDRLTGRSAELRYHTRLVLTLVACVYVAGFALLLMFDERFVGMIGSAFRNGGLTPTEWRSVRSIVVEASVLSLNSRSLGMPFEPATVAALPKAASWVLILLMAVGGGPAGTAGGLKLTTLFLLGRGARRGSQGERLPVECGFALFWAMGFALLVAVGYAGMLWAAPQLPPDRLLLVTVSAITNTGLSHDALSIVLVPLILLSLLMVLGRILPILILWRMASRLDQAETIP
ncbi:TrkH family potassium uptake protein [Humisphaera borealis]|uniref:TrkH family potassium uptake protein n=1 Tax=Humisphaera borealis TaxID=2807512 RepID=A0A7M2X2I5_9BACT|nr:potassium transporter TrkG [Humisphaera borealis]QOV91905.1 hypothetical protein IPV69_11345 [Humisphaera borealis]